MKLELKAGNVALSTWAEAIAAHRQRSTRPAGTDRGKRCIRRKDRRTGRAGLRHQHRLRETREHSHRGGRPRDPPAQHRAVACRGGRARDAGTRRAPHDGAEARVAGARLFRHRHRDGPAAVGHARSRSPARRAGAGIGRGVGRPGAARPHVGGDDRRRPGGAGRGGHAGRGGPRQGRAAAGDAGTQGRPGVAERDAVSTAYALAGLFEAERVFQAALVTGALSTDAAKGSDTPFDPRIHALRRHPGQIAVAASLRALLSGSAIRESHRVGDERIQDPYCLRCQPQVMGACLDTLRHAAGVLSTEANSVTDNPLVFANSDQALSGGNSTPSRLRSPRT